MVKSHETGSAPQNDAGKKPMETNTQAETGTLETKNTENTKEFELLKTRSEYQKPFVEELKTTTGADLIGSEADRKMVERGMRLKEARKAYLAEDEKAEKIKFSLKSVLWKTFRVGGLGQYNQEYIEKKNAYEKALKDYKDAFFKNGLIEDAEDVEIMVDFLRVTEICKQKSVRENIKAENSGWWDKASGGYMKIIEGYKNIGKDDKSKIIKYGKKILVGSTVGFGVAFGGGMAAGVAGAVSAAWAWRLFTMSVSATGFKGIYENMADAKRRQDSAKEAKNISRNSEVKKSMAMRLDSVNQKLDQIINDIDGKMQKEKQYSRWRSFGAVVTAGTFSYLGQMLGREIFGIAKEYSDMRPKSQLNTGPRTSSSFTDFKNAIQLENRTKNPVWFERMHPELKADRDINELKGIIETSSRSEENIIKLDPIKAGGSIEGSIREYLESHPELIEKYNTSKLSGGRKFDAGQIAFRMFDEISKNHNVTNLPVGASVNLTADGLRIADVIGFSVNEDELKSEVIVGENSQNSKIKNSEIEVIPIEQTKNENFSEAEKSYFERNAGKVMSRIETDLSSYYSEQKSTIDLSSKSDPEWVENAKLSLGFISGFRNEIMAGNKSMARELLRNAIAGENWNYVKNKTFLDAMREGNWSTNDKLNLIMRSLKEILGDEIKPKKGEIMTKWTLRIVDIASKQSKI